MASRRRRTPSHPPSRFRLCHVPDDVRRHHASAHRRLDRRPHALQGALFFFVVLWSLSSTTPWRTWSGRTASGSDRFDDFAGETCGPYLLGRVGARALQMLGRREGYESVNYRVHNVPLVAIGAALASLAGLASTGERPAHQRARRACLCHHGHRRGRAELSWMLLDVFTCGKPTLVGASTAS